MPEMPDFKTLDETVEFWESHDSADYWDDMDEAEFEVDLRKNLLHPDIVILTHRPENCPRCNSILIDTIIEHVAWNNGHMLIIRDVPALKCRSKEHKYILEKISDNIRRLLELETNRKIQPDEMIRVPVFSFSSSKNSICCGIHDTF